MECPSLSFLSLSDLERREEVTTGLDWRLRLCGVSTVEDGLVGLTAIHTVEKISSLSVGNLLLPYLLLLTICHKTSDSVYDKWSNRNVPK